MCEAYQWGPRGPTRCPSRGTWEITGDGQNAAEGSSELLRWPKGAAEMRNRVAWRNRTPVGNSMHLTTTKATPVMCGRGGDDALAHGGAAA